jgi:hypothetical protein
MQKHRAICFLICLSIILLTACQAPAPVAAPTVEPVVTVAPTAAPTIAPTPTAVPWPSPLPREDGVILTSLRPKQESRIVPNMMISGDPTGGQVEITRIANPDDPTLGANIALYREDTLAASFDLAFATGENAWIVFFFQDVNADGTDEILAIVNHMSNSSDCFIYVLEYNPAASAFETKLLLVSAYPFYFTHPGYSLYSPHYWFTTLKEKYNPSYIELLFSPGNPTWEKDADGKFYLHVPLFESEQAHQNRHEVWYDYRQVDGQWQCRKEGGAWQACKEAA